MPRRRPFWVWIASCVILGDLLLFVPWLVAQAIASADGSPSGNVYFGHHPQYVFTGNAIAEMGGRATWFVPVDALAVIGLAVPMLAIIFPIVVAAHRTGERQQIRTCPEQKWLNRLRAGVCPECSYDLRATPEKGHALLPRCPECGCLVREVAAARQATVRQMWAKFGEPPEHPLTVQFADPAATFESLRM